MENKFTVSTITIVPRFFFSSLSESFIKYGIELSGFISPSIITLNSAEMPCHNLCSCLYLSKVRIKGKHYRKR